MPQGRLLTSRPVPILNFIRDFSRNFRLQFCTSSKPAAAFASGTEIAHCSSAGGRSFAVSSLGSVALFIALRRHLIAAPDPDRARRRLSISDTPPFSHYTFFHPPLFPSCLWAFCLSLFTTRSKKRSGFFGVGNNLCRFSYPPLISEVFACHFFVKLLYYFIFVLI